ncbi:MAG: hypothetical protein U0T83_01515 [Bacteriovoracaceae bacterium]
MGLNLDFQLVEKSDHSNVEIEKFILTCVSVQNISTEFIHDVSTLLSIESTFIELIMFLMKGLIH